MKLKDWWFNRQVKKLFDSRLEHVQQDPIIDRACRSLHAITEYGISYRCAWPFPKIKRKKKVIEVKDNVITVNFK